MDSLHEMAKVTEELNMDLEVREVHCGDLYQVFMLESESYPTDEAATYDMLIYRQREAPDLMLGAYTTQGSLIGFICATRYHGKNLTHESMSMHIPNGESICIHSIVVKKEKRRQGVALHLLQEFINKVKTEQLDVARVLLISKSYLIPLYTRAGFELLGKSHVVHGKDPWYELQVTLSER